jgi:glutamate carboxypeptidase
MEQFLPYLDWINTQEQHMMHLTESWSRMNSGSYHVEGLARMHQALADNFLWLNGEMDAPEIAPLEMVDAQGRVAQIPLGKALRVRKRPDAPLQVFLGGHMDTVFGKDHPFQEPVFTHEGTQLNGPGAADLKGGLVVMLKALEALERSPWAEKIGWEVLINPDEEIGSQSSDVLLKEAAARNHLGLIYEPALADGTLAGARKGSGNFTIIVRGVAAHAGREFDKGENAIVRAASLVQQLHGLNGQQDGLTLNIGKIEGGGPLNMVPDLALVRFNVRVESARQQEWLLTQLERILSDAAAQWGSDAVMRHGGFTRAPKPMSEANLAVFEAVRDCGAMLGQEIAWKATGGCCDGNNLWQHGLPNVDTLGVRGGNIHSDKEYVILSSLVERARLSALLLMRLASGDLTLSLQ